jgi:uncharacterized protein (TIGR02246 family)
MKNSMITKQLLAVVCISMIAVESYSQHLSSKDSLQIHSMINDWNRAWDVKDHVLAAKWYSGDARFTNAFGDKRYGQREVEALLKEVFALPFVMSGKSETTEHKYQALNNDHVIVHTAVIRKGQQMPDGAILPDRQTTHLRVFHREGNAWKIKAHLISDAREKQFSKH